MTLGDRAGEAAHRVHGTRGLGLGSALLLVTAVAEPALPARFPIVLLVAPAALLLATGLVTLPREGLAAQDRALALPGHPSPTAAQVRRLAWLLVTVLLLLPRVFLAAYGIPHLNPLTGVVPLAWTRRLAITFLLGLLLAPILYLRSSRLYAPGVTVRRPRDIPREDGSHERRNALLALGYALTVAWGLLLRPFWTPFSLLAWPPEPWSLTEGTRGVAALAFAVVPPIVLFMSLVAHLGLLRQLARSNPPRRGPLAALAGLHILLILAAVTLHAYDLLWIARYESLARF